MAISLELPLYCTVIFNFFDYNGMYIYRNRINTSMSHLWSYSLHEEDITMTAAVIKWWTSVDNLLVDMPSDEVYFQCSVTGDKECYGITMDTWRQKKDHVNHASNVHGISDVQECKNILAYGSLDNLDRLGKAR